ncbi:hypothetical protein J7399_12565 [Shimia sp. R9_1]|uniref:hypothetical protein n=1 Tax=Shimia sp. R9_1 TaxID=2821111 RepID=UPI001ADC4BC2|nr:hypothetical protein [Shimia sp. R9_1]MBO9408267.1 hypothetical protein [Shimia sp. R9_1]
MSFTSREELDFDLQRAAIYHNMRAGHHRRFHQGAMAGALIGLFVPVLGIDKHISDLVNVPLSMIKNDLSVQPESVAGLLTFIGVVSILADLFKKPAELAGKHRAAETQYDYLKAELKRRSQDADISDLQALYDTVDSRFEEEHVVVNLISHNKVAAGNGLKLTYVPLWARFFGSFLPFSGYQNGTK